MKVKSLSRIRLLATPWTAAYQAPLSVGFSRQEYWSGVPLSSPEISLGILQILKKKTHTQEKGILNTFLKINLKIKIDKFSQNINTNLPKHIQEEIENLNSLITTEEIGLVF